MNKLGKKIKPKHIIRTTLLILCGAVIGLNVYTANANSLVGDKLPMPFGVGAAVVLSGSMEPTFSKGDLIVVQETDSLRVGQIVVYQDNGTLVVHRITQISENEVTTKGDANNSEDPPVEISRIKGEVLFPIPYAGTLVEWIKTPVGTILLLVAALLLMEIPAYKKKKKDSDELEKIKEEIRKLKDEATLEPEPVSDSESDPDSDPNS